ncbi:MAG: peptide chain release factor N(5)-glutamine methyltransferase, partial [Bacteroidales bacterium]|nr:peptide chain release factor N(5)-glutamine methyltransferase [Bacteroidales bacterium]
MTIKQLTNDITQSLQPLYDPREAAAVASWYVCARMRMERYELALRGNEPVDETLMPAIRRDMERLAEGCPLQYVLGETEFYGLSFKVSPAVLIPRPETEELVQRVVQQYEGQKVRIWDVGTGSGCIAISLAKMLPDVEVFATDISEDALAVARENAECNGVGVTFARHDMADVEHLPFGETRFDVIVSNPPYIPASDRATLHKNVTDYEPETALFVPDDDKLWCYRALARLAQRTLAPGGRLYVETYHDFHEELAEMLCQHGFSDVHSERDLNGRLRFVV